MLDTSLESNDTTLDISHDLHLLKTHAHSPVGLGIRITGDDQYPVLGLLSKTGLTSEDEEETGGVSSEMLQELLATFTRKDGHESKMGSTPLKPQRGHRCQCQQEAPRAAKA